MAGRADGKLTLGEGSFFLPNSRSCPVSSFPIDRSCPLLFYICRFSEVLVLYNLVLCLFIEISAMGEAVVYKPAQTPVINPTFFQVLLKARKNGA